MFQKKRSSKQNDFIAAIDIGSRKISCIIAKFESIDLDQEPELKLLGIGQHLSQGFRNGAITDIKAFGDCVLNAVHIAEQQANTTLEEVIISLPAYTLNSQIISDSVEISSSTIEEFHVQKLLNKRDWVPQESYLIHAFPIEYQIDDINGIKDPRGLCGKSLSIRLHILFANKNFIKNIFRCIGQCHLDIIGFIASPYASSISTLMEDEIQLGVSLVDFGGYGTSITSFIEGNMININYIPIGGMHITYDIARGLSTPIAHAEKLKILHGSLLKSFDDEKENILIPTLGEDFNGENTSQISKSFLSTIIQSRVEEILCCLMDMIKQSNLNHIATQRFVFTGGSSQIIGMKEFSVSFLNRSVRIGNPSNFYYQKGFKLDPSLATCIGLIQCAQNEDMNFKNNSKSSIFLWKIFRKLNQWIKRKKDN